MPLIFKFTAHLLHFKSKYLSKEPMLFASALVFCFQNLYQNRLKFDKLNFRDSFYVLLPKLYMEYDELDRIRGEISKNFILER